MLSAYQERDEILREHGFGSYREYLESETWREKRDRVLSGKPKCVCCRRRRASQVHHEHYSHEALFGASTAGLVPVCRQCHRKAEINKSGMKRSLDQANQVLRNGRGRRKRKGWCPDCRRNRSHKGGPCPPCRKSLVAGERVERSWLGV